jgi:hypothetical protein
VVREQRVAGGVPKGLVRRAQQATGHPADLERRAVEVRAVAAGLPVQQPAMSAAATPVSAVSASESA